MGRSHDDLECERSEITTTMYKLAVAKLGTKGLNRSNGVCGQLATCRVICFFFFLQPPRGCRVHVLPKNGGGGKKKKMFAECGAIGLHQPHPCIVQKAELNFGSRLFVLYNRKITFKETDWHL